MTDEMRAALVAGEDSKVLWMAWNGFRAAYSFTNQTVTSRSAAGPSAR